MCHRGGRGFAKGTECETGGNRPAWLWQKWQTSDTNICNICSRHCSTCWPLGAWRKNLAIRLFVWWWLLLGSCILYSSSHCRNCNVGTCWQLLVEGLEFKSFLIVSHNDNSFAHVHQSTTVVLFVWVLRNFLPLWAVGISEWMKIRKFSCDCNLFSPICNLSFLWEESNAEKSQHNKNKNLITKTLKLFLSVCLSVGVGHIRGWQKHCVWIKS